MIDIRKLIADTTEFFAGDAKRIQHFIKVRSLANLIGGGEGMTDNELNVLDAAAVVHDVAMNLHAAGLDGLYIPNAEDRVCVTLSAGQDFRFHL